MSQLKGKLPLSILVANIAVFLQKKTQSLVPFLLLNMQGKALLLAAT
jgi:hypothetical protein